MQSKRGVSGSLGHIMRQLDLASRVGEGFVWKCKGAEVLGMKTRTD